MMFWSEFITINLYICFWGVTQMDFVINCAFQLIKYKCMSNRSIAMIKKKNVKNYKDILFFCYDLFILSYQW